MKASKIGLIFLIFGLGTGVARSADAPSARTKEFDELLSCRTVSDPKERLNCYDRNANMLGVLKDQDQIVVVDRKSIKQARRGLFGFTLPKLGFLGAGPQDDEDISEIRGEIRSARPYGRDQWEFTLEDGAIWRQIDKIGRAHV